MIQGPALLRLLGNETCYGILAALCTGERCACELPTLVRKTQSNTSMHLAKLLDAGVVTMRKDGKKRIYRLADPRIARLLAEAS